MRIALGVFNEDKSLVNNIAVISTSNRLLVCIPEDIECTFTSNGKLSKLYPEKGPITFMGYFSRKFNKTIDGYIVLPGFVIPELLTDIGQITINMPYTIKTTNGITYGPPSITLNNEEICKFLETNHEDAVEKARKYHLFLEAMKNKKFFVDLDNAEIETNIINVKNILCAFFNSSFRTRVIDYRYLERTKSGVFIVRKNFNDRHGSSLIEA